MFFKPMGVAMALDPCKVEKHKFFEVSFYPMGKKTSWLAWLFFGRFLVVYKNAGFRACVCFFQYNWNKCFSFGCEITRSKIPCNCKDFNVHEGIFQDAPFRSPENASFIIPVVPSDCIPERGRVYPHIQMYNCITQKSALVAYPIPFMYGIFTYMNGRFLW